MKYRSFLFGTATTLSLTIVSTLPVNAVTLQDVRTQVQENRQESQATRAAIREDRQELGQARRDNRAELHAIRLERRFNAYYTRLSNFISRVSFRLDMMSKNGKDVATPKAKLDAAKVKLEEAKVLGAEAVSLFRAIVPEKYAQQRAQALAARDKAMAARKAFKDALLLITEAVKLGKGAEAKTN